MFIEGREVRLYISTKSAVPESQSKFSVPQNDQPIGTVCVSYWLKSSHGLLCHLYEGAVSISERPVAYGVIKISCQY
jgi:hypothetical protein